MYDIDDTFHGCCILSPALRFQRLPKHVAQVGYGVPRPFQASHSVTGMANCRQSCSNLENRALPEIAVEFVGGNIGYFCDEILMQADIYRPPSLWSEVLLSRRNQGCRGRGGNA